MSNLAGFPSQVKCCGRHYPPLRFFLRDLGWDTGIELPDLPSECEPRLSPLHYLFRSDRGRAGQQVTGFLGDDS